MLGAGGAALGHDPEKHALDLSRRRWLGRVAKSHFVALDCSVEKTAGARDALPFCLLLGVAAI
jgi:hypothetical protein